ncbi:MAG TPA: asparagine synthase-related protein, partial [Micromonosporaceae bacterium]|nr:asparagine synthase-related protein [Micromonosporaceae bacterium]
STDPYQAYLHWQYGKIQQYNVWHEDRTAAGSGIEARVPFLDHRLVELVAAVPVPLRRELLWDKQILRRGMRGILPDDVVARPKQAFFYGAGLKHTYRMFLRMLDQHGAALVDEASSAPGMDEIIDAAALRDTLARSVDDPTGAEIEIALRIVNLGLLSGMIAELPRPTNDTPAGTIPQSIEVRVWDDQVAEVERHVGLRPTVTADLVPQLAPGVQLLTNPAEPGVWYVTVNGAIEYVVDDDEPRYRDLLRQCDGSTPLREMLDDLGCTLDDLYPTIADLLEQEIIELR